MYYYVLLIVFVYNVNGEDPVVQIPQGKLLGRSRLNRDGGTFYSFQNIPYGKPPIGDLRFKAAQPADGWQDIRDATKDLPQCIQIPTGEGQEDCLYLNVYVPELPTRNGSLKPVMVWVYGGGYTTGSAQDSIYGPEFILTKEVILVTLNYRLGIYGFLTLDDPNLGITGNAGIKDQVLALKWVKNNILHFGGNPDNVLIFGESAGALSVHLHILSPMSKGLFHKAIFQSGSALADFLSLEIRNNAVILAEALGIQTENWEEMLKSLQALPATSLTAAELLLTATYRTISAPVIEVASNESNFLSERPFDTIRSGNYNQVPFITGFNDAEGLLFEIQARQLTNQSILITNFSEWIPSDLQIQPGSEDEAILSEKLKKFYYGNSEPSREDISGAVYLTTDYTFGFPAYRSVLEHLKTALCPMYFYFFTADTKLNLYKQRDSIAALFPGASHADDVFYLFQTMWTPSNISLGSTEDRDIRNMVNLWTNFANNGKPTTKCSQYAWKPVTRNKFNYLHIDSKKSIPKVNPKRRSFQFWSKIYEEYFPN